MEDKRVLVREGEFARVLKAASRDGNTLSPVLRDAWDSGDLRTLTKTSPDVATGAHINIVAHITQDELLKELRQTDAVNGFANRFLWVASRRSKLLPDGGRLPDADFKSMGDAVRQQIRLIRSAGRMRWDRDAQAAEAWRLAYPVLTSARCGLFGSVTSRAEAQVLRLSLLYALLDYQRGEDALIREEHIGAALAVWFYCEASAQCIFGDGTGDPKADRAMEVLRRSESKEMGRTEIGEAVFGKHSTKQKLDAVRDLLVRNGLIDVAKTKGERDRTIEMWSLRETVLT